MQPAANGCHRSEGEAMMSDRFPTRLPIARGLIAILLLSLLTLVACARQPIILERLVVRNATPASISDVEVRHEPTMRFGAVSVILPANSYELSFAKAPMLAKQGVISWRDDTGRLWSKTLPLPDKNIVRLEGQAVTLVYLIEPAGLVTVSLEP